MNELENWLRAEIMGDKGSDKGGKVSPDPESQSSK